MPGGNRLIFTDLDGTFLDGRTYSWARSVRALELALETGWRVVFCSSKTAAEIRALLVEMGFALPFISENGGGVFLPRHWLSSSTPQFRGPAEWSGISLGASYELLTRELAAIARAAGVHIRGFADMPAEEIAQTCGLALRQAQLAKERQFDEPFLILDGDSEAAAKLGAMLHVRGLRLTRGGRFYHVTGPHDKGKAMRVLNRLIRSRHGALWTVGIGDSLNDLPMLAEVDVPVLVQAPDGRYEEAIIARIPRVLCVPAPGPRAWTMAVTRILKADSQIGEADKT
jgi:mannosyl-3-phosphoglycerate phosphatase